MPSNNKHNVSEKELDNLLKQAFLNLDTTNPKNKNIMETVSNQYLNKLPLNLFIKNYILNKFVIGFNCLAIAIAVGIFFYFKTNTQVSSVNINPSEIIISKQEVLTENTSENDKLKSLELNNDDNVRKEPANTITKPFNKLGLSLNEPLPQQEFTKAMVNTEKKQLQGDTGYVFPKLSEKEIKDNEKQKQKLKKLLYKKSKDKYALVVNNNEFGHPNDTLTMFYMQNTEVTNLDYRTFLFDLLIQNKLSDFLIAKPHQNLWLNTIGSSRYNKLKDLYFSDKFYNDYPVVNISTEGAELYCKWLSELNKSNNNDEMIEVRLPSEKEWILAARGKLNSDYPWGQDSIQNKKGCYLANFCVKKLSNQLNPNVYCDKKNNTNAYTSGGIMIGDSVLTVPVYSYNPNIYGLFCMSGNVAEMVYDNKTKTLKTKGGSWNSDFEHCKINSEDEVVGALNPSNTIGFRPIFRIRQRAFFGDLNREDVKTGFPTLNEVEIQKFTEQKKKMIDGLIKFNSEKYAFIPMGSCIYKKDTISVQSFYMQNTEVTNLEYRIFLADLLIQNKLTDYLIAKPNQLAWNTKFSVNFNEPMFNLYFSHPAYDNYPVVNISRKGAQKYCYWLTNEANKVLKEKNKPLIYDVRLPSDFEWVYAASNQKNYSKYAHGNENLRDNKGKYEVNYNCSEFKDFKYDSIRKLYIPISKKVSYIDDGAFHTVYAKSYKPNNYGLYCMAGNVSEMVNNYNKITHTFNIPATKGGSWYSCDYFLEIDATDEFEYEINASPMIGFRPVLTFGKAKP